MGIGGGVVDNAENYDGLGDEEQQITMAVIDLLRDRHANGDVILAIKTILKGANLTESKI
jgi:hypothetical protein